MNGRAMLGAAAGILGFVLGHRGIFVEEGGSRNNGTDAFIGGVVCALVAVSVFCAVSSCIGDRSQEQDIEQQDGHCNTDDVDVEESTGTSSSVGSASGPDDIDQSQENSNSDLESEGHSGNSDVGVDTTDSNSDDGWDFVNFRDIDIQELGTERAQQH
ncbi:hypothetical protein EDL81_04070 [Ehrlichia ruminantium]|uniref:hypothetical protein n=1 Tax=Ehrlichia ruminantium TaxID=779 RepID=UPI00130E1806|nr:hypothetical protein [Ehrlichia ruminantium]QGR02793.1 hypothetical protein EDL81_04070 [Ehrlichia ruminantium]